MSEDGEQFVPEQRWVAMPPDEKFLSMMVWRDMLLVATDHGIYRLKNRKLRRIQIAGPMPIFKP